MSETGPATAQASVTISADPAAVYAMITDLPTMASLAAEANAMEWHKGESAQPGAVFKGHNSSGSKKWTTTCTVTDAEPGRVFAFDVKSAIIPIAHWRYDIKAVDGGCRVTEQTWDKRPGWFHKVGAMATGVKDRTSANADHIKVTLERLKAAAEKKAGA